MQLCLSADGSLLLEQGGSAADKLCSCEGPLVGVIELQLKLTKPGSSLQPSRPAALDSAAVPKAPQGSGVGEGYDTLQDGPHSHPGRVAGQPGAGHSMLAGSTAPAAPQLRQPGFVPHPDGVGHRHSGGSCHRGSKDVVVPSEAALISRHAARMRAAGGQQQGSDGIFKDVGGVMEAQP